MGSQLTQSSELTLEQVLAELKRELGMRHKVYPRQVSRGALKQELMDYRIACIEKAIQAIEQQIPTQPAQLDLL